VSVGGDVNIIVGYKHIKFTNAQRVTRMYQNKSIKEILYKANAAAIGYHKTCRQKQPKPD
jgi:hypothetical protein